MALVNAGLGINRYALRMYDPDILLDAIAHARAGRHGEAERILLGVIARAPDDPYAVFLLGECALATGRPVEAVGRLLSEALRLRPLHRDSRLALARAQLASRQPGGSACNAGAVGGRCHAWPGAVPSWHRAERSRAPVGGGWRPSTHALATQPGDAETQLNCGNAHAELDDVERAERHIRQAIQLDPSMAEAHASLGHLTYRPWPLDRRGGRDGAGDRDPAGFCGRALESGRRAPACWGYGGGVARL